MKTDITRLIALGVALAASLSLGTFNAAANLEVSASVAISGPADFYEPLGPSGTWVEVGNYGRCWHPAHVVAEWRPYCDGTWVWTDCGWYWESDEPWAWACYHYGTWVDDPAVGWVWVPGIEWAPAWVSWRVGGGHIGWAPCAPVGVVVVAPWFVFVEENHFHERHRPSTVIINTTTIINNTTVINNVGKRENRNVGGRQQTVVVNNGPDVNHIEKVSGKKIKPITIAEADHHTPVPPTLKHKGNQPAEKSVSAPANPGQPKEQTDNHPKERRIDQPVVTPEHKLPPAPAPELPNKPVTSDRNLPAEKHEVIIPQQPPAHEVPMTPQPVPPTKREIVPPAHEVIPPHQPPLHDIPPVRPDNGGGNERNSEPAHDRDNDKHHD